MIMLMMSYLLSECWLVDSVQAPERIDTQHILMRKMALLEVGDI